MPVENTSLATEIQSASPEPLGGMTRAAQRGARWQCLTYRRGASHALLHSQRIGRRVLVRRPPILPQRYLGFTLHPRSLALGAERRRRSIQASCSWGALCLYRHFLSLARVERPVDSRSPSNCDRLCSVPGEIILCGSGIRCLLCGTSPELGAKGRASPHSTLDQVVCQPQSSPSIAAKANASTRCW